jgi:Nucleotidyl transferase AbiEii toxin, Type IV TA system
LRGFFDGFTSTGTVFFGRVYARRAKYKVRLVATSSAPYLSKRGPAASQRFRLKRDSERSVFIDLLFASSGIEPEIVSAVEELAVLEDVTVRVATRAHLIALKVLARDDRHRPQDWDDLRALLADASEAEVAAARDALAIIEQRGYNRGRALADDLARALADTSA